MSHDAPRPGGVLMYSPPKRDKKKESTSNPSEFLLLKPFSRSPNLQIVVPKPGESRSTLLTVQNIDDYSSRVYFKIPADKKIVIRPEALIIHPQSVEVFEIIAVEAEESFRVTIQVFAPDIKYYRGGQVSVAVNVKKIVNSEKKKKPKPVIPLVKPKAVTVPQEFIFQPSREERKRGASKEHIDTVIEIPQQKTFDVPVDKDATTDLEQIRRYSSSPATPKDASRLKAKA
ncbi:uncharacterized protein LOC100906820 [Galendromus occidentalis]|uniref:Uncharacterized protein LOC100906820 n=1 Tax=Galendromus occidentalis TaxID=34638 RepID=A0AAJ7L8I4_9ACAR|nr:uncharacterized protein LOC100906820 [Galendromus occidentalis]